jgi:hypothetical protein
VASHDDGEGNVLVLLLDVVTGVLTVHVVRVTDFAQSVTHVTSANIAEHGPTTTRSLVETGFLFSLSPGEGHYVAGFGSYIYLFNYDFAGATFSHVTQSPLPAGLRASSVFHAGIVDMRFLRLAARTEEQEQSITNRIIDFSFADGKIVVVNLFTRIPTVSITHFFNVQKTEIGIFPKWPPRKTHNDGSAVSSHQ